MQENQHLLITGLVRDSGPHLKSEIERIENHAREIFASVDFFLVESDSTDSTQLILNQLKKIKNNFEFVSFESLETTFPNRIERLRFCRNQYVQKIRADKRYSECGFILVVDFDIKNRKLNLEPIVPLLSMDAWDALFTNQRGPYYDILALRCDGWVESDCFQLYQELSRSMSRARAKNQAIWSRMIKIPISAPMIEVQSAFGGLGLYRRACFECFDYSPATFEQFQESEHVSLHRKITLSGGKLFIVPAMTNFSFSPHNLSAYRIFRFLDKVTRSHFFKGIRNLLRRLLA